MKSIWTRMRRGMTWRMNLYLWTPLKRIRAIIIPAGRSKPYDFAQARKYWKNVPKAEGGNPFNTDRLQTSPDEVLVREFDKEAELARRKEERKVGFARALESIADVPEPQVMDYGSGIGFYGLEILASRKDARVTFVDINETNLAAIRRIAGVKGWGSRASYIPVADETAGSVKCDSPLDLIMSMGVLHHTPHARQIVRNIGRLLKVGGIFEVMLYNHNYLRELEQEKGRRLNLSAFGALTDPEVGGIKNPYSEPYDEIKTRSLFEGYEWVSLDHPTPFYDTYRFRKHSPSA